MRYWATLVEVTDQVDDHPLRVPALYNLAISAWRSNDPEGWQAARQQLVVLLADVEARQVGSTCIEVYLAFGGGGLPVIRLNAIPRAMLRVLHVTGWWFEARPRAECGCPRHRRPD